MSSLLGLSSSREEVLARLRILYLSPLTGWPSLSHLKLTFGASSVSHSNLAMLPVLISTGATRSLNTGFTVEGSRNTVSTQRGDMDDEWVLVVGWSGPGWEVQHMEVLL